MIEIRLLLPGDDRSRFESGNPFLDNYFRRYSGQNQFRHRIGASYVAIEDGNIRGYLTVSTGEIHIDELPQSQQHRFPRYPIPILRLARLAVGQAHKGKRIGDALLRYAFELAERISQEVGCAGLVVDAKPDAVPFYQKYGFVPLTVHDGELRNAPVAMFLSIHTIPRG